jgi:SNF2 family DNA or RNA helicase
MRRRQDLRDYQHKFVDLLKRQEGVILALDMGAGKSAITLTAVRDMLDDGTVARVLIVAPLLVAERTWPDEIGEWEHTAPLQYAILTGTAAQRQAAARTDKEIHIINRENLPWLWDLHGQGKTWPYDCLVIDEASMLKNGRMRTRGTRKLTRFGVLAKAQDKCDRIIELTGTPAPKGLQNLWGLAYVADSGKRLGTSRTAFEQRWFTTDYLGFSLEPRPGAEAEIMSRMTDIMFSLNQADYAELPPLVYNTVEITLPKKALEEYGRFKRTLYSEAYDVEAVTSGVLTQKLLQFANGSMYREDGDDVWIHDAKIEALERIIEEAQGEPVLVAYNFKFDRKAILKRYPKAVVLREDSTAVDRWNKGQIPLLLAHPASAGHGLNLQKGGNISVWYGLTHDLELYQQFNKRLHRPGQLKPVFIHHIVAQQTVDSVVLPRLSAKDATQARIIEAVITTVKDMSTNC